MRIHTPAHNQVGKPSFSRLLYCAFGLLLLFAAAPHEMLAQAAQPEPATQPQPKNGSQAGYFKEKRQAEKKSETEEQNEYRHSASVQWLADALHIDVETAATAFEYINFAAILLLIGIPLAKVLPKTLRTRQAKLSFDLDQAQARTTDARERLKAVEEKLEGLDAEIAAIRKQVEEEMRADEVRSKNLLEEETARIVTGVEQEIAAAAAQAQRGLKQFAAGLAVDRALSRLKIDAETDRALFAEFASSVAGGRDGRRHSSKGDRN